MNSRERIKAAVNREKIDCIPVGPYMGNHCAIVTGTKMIDYYTKADKMAHAQIKAWELYGQDIVCVQSDNYYIVEGFGLKAEYHENSTPTVIKPAVENLKDIAKLKLPNPYRDGRMPVYIEAVDRVSQYLGKEAVIRTPGTGPFTMAGHLMGIQQFLIELAKIEHEMDDADEKAIIYLLELCTEILIEFGKAMLKAGSDIVQCGDSLASLDMISPDMYKRFAFPYEKKYFDEISPYAKAKGAFKLLHICGNNTGTMELYAATGADIIEVDHKSDLKLWTDTIGNKVTLIGNLNPTRILLQGSVEEVREASLRCIKDARGHEGGFILGSGCEVPLYAPRENIMEMIKTAREYIIQ
ncbi:MAG TPA: hypothetical protein GXX20_01620 [Clostridiaceae bacterium]|nr:hypothetical protein [Clostridiaceae bacterium]